MRTATVIGFIIILAVSVGYTSAEDTLPKISDLEKEIIEVLNRPSGAELFEQCELVKLYNETPESERGKFGLEAGLKMGGCIGWMKSFLQTHYLIYALDHLKINGNEKQDFSPNMFNDLFNRNPEIGFCISSPITQFRELLVPFVNYFQREENKQFLDGPSVSLVMLAMRDKYPCDMMLP
jgi:hypothetical protein